MKLKYLHHLWQRRLPGQLVIQYTDHCNAHCPQCGMRVTNIFSRKKLHPGEVKRMLDAAAARGVVAVSLTGGEPMLFLDEIVELIRYAGSLGIEYIRTGTNGFFFQPRNGQPDTDRIKRIAEKLADTPLRNLWVSIDSADPMTHETMRGLPGVIAGIEAGVPIFAEAGIYLSANLGINRNLAGGPPIAPPMEEPVAPAFLEEFYHQFRNGFEKFFQFVEGLGFTIVNTCYPMSISHQDIAAGLNPIYAATSQDFLVKFTPAEKQQLFQALLDTLPRYRSRMRIFSPCSSLYTLSRQYNGHPQAPYACKGGIDFFFVDCQDGNTYPCGYRGNDNFGKFWDLDWDRVDRQHHCQACDWECFRDPSELLGPVAEGLFHPLRIIQKFSRDPEYFQHWHQDLRYYRACDYFDGRRPPDLARLRRFA